jgi:hypothetical protein
MTQHTTQDSQSELEFWEGMFGKSTNAKGNTEGYITYHDFTERLNAYVTTRVKEALELARSKDPHKCEFGHEVYSHNTVDGWCCACEADQAFMEAEIEARVKEAERLARMSELEMFKKVPVEKMTKETAEHISRRYKALTTTTNGKGE